MLGEDNDVSENFKLHKDEKFILEEQNIERDYRDMVNKSSNTRSRAKNGLLGRTPQDRLFASELSSFLREISFNEYEFSVVKPISDIK